MIDLALLFATALLFGGMALYSFGFAPLLFGALEPAAAGRLLRVAFPWCYVFVAATAALAAGLAVPSDAPTAGALAIAAAGAVDSRQVLTPRINAARDAQLSGDVAEGRRFRRLHGASVAVNSAQMAVAAYALAGFA